MGCNPVDLPFVLPDAEDIDRAVGDVRGVVDVGNGEVGEQPGAQLGVDPFIGGQGFQRGRFGNLDLVDDLAHARHGPGDAGGCRPLLVALDEAGHHHAAFHDLARDLGIKTVIALEQAVGEAELDFSVGQRFADGALLEGGDACRGTCAYRHADRAAGRKGQTARRCQREKGRRFEGHLDSHGTPPALRRAIGHAGSRPHRPSALQRAGARWQLRMSGGARMEPSPAGDPCG